MVGIYELICVLDPNLKLPGGRWRVCPSSLIILELSSRYSMMMPSPLELWLSDG